VPRQLAETETEPYVSFTYINHPKKKIGLLGNKLITYIEILVPITLQIKATIYDSYLYVICYCFTYLISGPEMSLGA